MFQQTKSFFTNVNKTWLLTKPYWQSENKRRIWAHFLCIIALNLIVVYMLVLLNEWFQTFYNALERKDIAAFWYLNLRFCGLAAIYIIAAVYKNYLTQMFQINWRQWLSLRYLKGWTDNSVFYRMEMTQSEKNPQQTPDNPDQRIQEDIDAFTRQTLSLSLGLFDALLTLGAFIVILWRLSESLSYTIGSSTFAIPGLMVWATLLYCICGTGVAHIIGRKQIKLNYEQQRKEAVFRHRLVRVREYADSIALDQGGPFEKHQLGLKLGLLIDNFRSLIKAQKTLSWFTSGFGQAAVVFPMIIAGPRYLSGVITLGVLMQIVQAFNRAQDNMSWIIVNYGDLAGWRATTIRLAGFDESLQQMGHLGGNRLTHTQGNRVDLKHIDIQLPSGESLVHDANISIEPGDSVIVQGPSGMGKSTLFRTIAGIWPYGSGEITTPTSAIYMPQKPYIPTGSLRDALIYPYSEQKMWGDTALQAALRDALLPQLCDLLNQEDNWGQRLSLGEQQRLAFARVFLHQPTWVFADEATSGLDAERELLLYQQLLQLLEQKNGALVSVAHRAALETFHRRFIRLTPTANNNSGTVSLCRLTIGDLPSRAQ